MNHPSSVSTGNSFLSSGAPFVNHWPSAITLSGNAAVEDILTDIPFFSVGLLAFGVLTFFFAMRRLSLLTGYIHAAAIFAFIGSILDLSQILSRGVVEIDAGVGISSVWPLIVMRELAFSASIGFRFLFFWTFVGEPPRGEPLIPLSQQEVANTSARQGLHSGRWENGGVVGVIFKWTSLLTVFAIPVLEAMWRIIAAFRQSGPVYYTDTVMEIAVSGLFILKILVNTGSSHLSPWWQTLRDYFVVILSLLVNIGIAVGNLLCFELSESSLGRFLQAVELYILILFVLISAFYKDANRSSMSSISSVSCVKPRNRVPPPFEGIHVSTLDEGFHISPIPAMSMTPDERLSTSLARPTLGHSRLSTTSRLSLWINRRLSTQASSSERDQTRLWNQDQAERGMTPTTEKQTRGSFDESPIEPKQMVKYGDQVFTPVSRTASPFVRTASALVRAGSSVVATASSPKEPTPLQIVFSAPPEPISNSPQDLDPISTSVSSMALSDFVARRASPEPSLPQRSATAPSFGGMSLSSYYAAEERIPSYTVPDTRVIPDSPVYGLEGLLAKNSQLRMSTLTDGISSARSSGIENLLRQQAELDKTIESLRVFDRRESTIDPFSSERPGDVSHTSVSVRSEISLSNFPEPPFGSRPILLYKNPKQKESTPQVPQPNRKRFELDDAQDLAVQLEPPRMPAAVADGQQLFPAVARGSDMFAFRGAKFDSKGTQYDVTSFIGNLTSPGEDPLSAASDKAWTTDDEEENTTIFSVARKSSVSRAVLIRNRLAAEEESLEPMSSSSRRPFPSKPLNNVPSSLRPQGRPLPSRPLARLAISAPIIAHSNSLQSPISAFERPRPAPSMNTPPDSAIARR